MRTIEIDDAHLQDFKVWHYMKLEFFRTLVEQRKLWFSSVDKYWKDDPREGSFTKDHFARREQMWDRFNNPEHMRQTVREYEATVAQTVFVNCWSGKQEECALMWKAYAPQGVALQTTLPKLKEAVPQWITFGVIKYLDHDTAVVECDHRLDWYLFKAKEFAGEEEIRLICENIPRGHSEYGKRIVRRGTRQIEIDIEKLVSRVVLAPGSNCESEVRAILQKAGLNRPVEDSALTRAGYH